MVDLCKELGISLPIGINIILLGNWAMRKKFEPVEYIKAIKSAKGISWRIDDILPDSSLCLIFVINVLISLV